MTSKKKTEPVGNGLLDELRRWGGPAEMSAFEAVMWNAESDPRLRDRSRNPGSGAALGLLA